MPASIVIPTRGRPAYLEVALASIAPQAARGRRGGARGRRRRRLAARLARWRATSARATSRTPRPLGLNVARNTGVERSAGELVVFVDDDVDA